jgi:muramoyltetrapeptide carboxypeptidase
VKLQAVKKGDIVDIVAPSGYTDPSELTRAANYIKSIGLIPRYPKDLLKKDLFFANTDKRRAEILQTALKAKDSAAVWCLRGGNGGQRLIPLMKTMVIRPAKIFIGLSDICVFHHLLNRKNIPTIHGPILIRMGKPHQSLAERKEVEALLFGKKRESEFINLKAVNAKAKRTQIIRAPIVGGNLTVLHAMLGSPKAFTGKGKVVLLEEINEEPYKIDRMLQSCLQAGVFDKAKAIVFGDFVGCTKTAKDKKALKEVISRFGEQIKIPVVSGLRTGHGDLQRPVIFQTKSFLYVGRRPRLLIPSCIYE